MSEYGYEGGADTSIVVSGYTIRRRIGSGGFASVYEAVDEKVMAAVALKVLTVDHADAGTRRRFERECQVMGALRGTPGVVPVYTATYSSDGRPVIVMEFMAGGSAFDRLRARGVLEPGEVERIGVRIAGALQVAHERDISHRDIKPENILLDSEGQAALGDFGIAIIDDLLTSTRTDASLTPPHAPPERFLAENTIDLASGDIYSLASSLYQLLTGRPPFGTVSDGGLAGLINRIVKDPVPPIERSDVPEHLASAIAKGLAKDPAQRPKSAAEFGALLRSGLSAIPTIGGQTTRDLPDEVMPTISDPGPEGDTNGVVDDRRETIIRPKDVDVPPVPPGEPAPAPKWKTWAALAGGFVGVAILAFVAVSVLLGRDNGNPRPAPGLEKAIKGFRVDPVRDKGIDVLWNGDTNGRPVLLVACAQGVGTPSDDCAAQPFSPVTDPESLDASQWGQDLAGGRYEHFQRVPVSPAGPGVDPNKKLVSDNSYCFWLQDPEQPAPNGRVTQVICVTAPTVSG